MSIPSDAQYAWFRRSLPASPLVSAWLTIGRSLIREEPPDDLIRWQRILRRKSSNPESPDESIGHHKVARDTRTAVAPCFERIPQHRAIERSRTGRDNAAGFEQLPEIGSEVALDRSGFASCVNSPLHVRFTTTSGTMRRIAARIRPRGTPSRD